MHRTQGLTLAAAAGLFGAGLCVLTAFEPRAIRLRVDHVTIAGKDLGALQNAFNSAGIRCEYGGKHSNAMTEMAIASFPDGSYVELIAAQKGASVAKHYWGSFIESDAGACAWAVSVDDIQAAAERLRKSGVEITPSTSGRKRPDGVALLWSSGSLGPEPRGSFFPFLIQDKTPHALRVYPKGKPSAPQFEGVGLVVTAVRDLNPAIAKWRSTFGLGEPRRQSDPELQAQLAWFTGTPVVLAAPSGAGSLVAERLRRFGEAPFAIVLRGGNVPAGKGSSWFGDTVHWFDPSQLNGARVGVWKGSAPVL